MSSEYSGKFVVRLPLELHRKLVSEAQKRRQSLNNICVEFLSEGFKKGGQSEKIQHKYQNIISMVKNRFGQNLIGILIFGSQISGEATHSSDIDFLIVLSDKISLTRSLYHWWDETTPSESDTLPASDHETINPQFVHIPSYPHESGGLWFEVAMSHNMLWEKGKRVTKFLDALKEMIDKDQIRRYWSNGHPFWVWKKHEEQVTSH